MINDAAPAPIPANGTLRLPTVAAGRYHVLVTDVARWCDVTGGPSREIEIGTTGEYDLSIDVTCRTTFRDWLLYDGSGEIRLFDLTGDPAQSSRLGYLAIHCDGYCTSGAVSPDGGQVAWVEVNGMHVMAADGSGRRKLIGQSQFAESPTWSADGAELAYVDSPDGTTPDLYVVRVDGSAPPRRLTFGGAYDPAWSPDGRTIVFSRLYGPAPTRQLWLMDPTGVNLRPLGASGVIQLSPSWSPDGQSIVYSSDFRMRIIELDGSNDRPVGPEKGFQAAWSRDGTRIAFVTYDESGCHSWLATMTPAGTDASLLGPFGDCDRAVPPPYNPGWGY